MVEENERDGMRETHGEWVEVDEIGRVTNGDLTLLTQMGVFVTFNKI